MRIFLLLLLSLIYQGTSHASSSPYHFDTSIKWNNKTLWDRSQKHSNDFFIQYGWDNVSGSFASDISSDGKVLSDKRYIISTSRMIYGLSQSSKNNPSYISYAKKQAKFLLEKMTAQDQNGLYFKETVDSKGNLIAPENLLTVNYQAYGLNGLVALYGVTNDPALLKKIEALYAGFYKRFHDPVHLGFFDKFDQLKNEPVQTKSFNSTIYVATSFLFDLAQLPTRNKTHYLKTIEELADLVAEYFIDQKTNWIIENFSADWKPEWRGWQVQGDFTIGVTGHNYQAAWFLMRAAELKTISSGKKSLYLEKAQTILTSMLNSNSLDLNHGGVFDVFKRESDEPMWHTNKGWWQQAEMILALTKADRIGLFSDANVAKNARVARNQALKFYFDYFVDYKNGGEFTVVDQKGSPILTENKGGPGTASYHQVELARFMFEYSK